MPILYGADKRKLESEYIRQHISEGLLFSAKRSKPGGVFVCEITRCYPGTLAKDTLSYATEHIREAILLGLGIKEETETEVHWMLNQRRSQRKEVIVCAWF